MVSSGSKELFPENEDPRKKLREFSRGPSGNLTASKPSKRQTRRTQDGNNQEQEDEDAQGTKPKKVVVKGYEQEQNHQSEGGREESSAIRASTISQNPTAPGPRQQTSLLTISENPHNNWQAEDDRGVGRKDHQQSKFAGVLR
ncbi:uncharacterized protein MELLADRAFT_110744 [Melampsora larici-populina 98AG31]|uniref:Uncharacterized protein n=1 Tax=Melampsora larici-populina (strain 98AG31 / pathotype 3-4-7) TaxID=747676 RepID=F4S0T5_MELLP|nr:uncharacterized protein MELLADRAFT_110744 [Melampsora larici-populina 98AG31]EGG01641.1 hypothetical protein MELLADRAFT_110744 [Melampsora larici-populina 98AG31]